MLNEGAYENIRREITRCDCPFEKAILSTCCACSLARKHHVAEREAVSCSAAPAHETCRKLHDLLREKALFALKLPHHQEKLPHAKEARIGLPAHALIKVIFAENELQAEDLLCTIREAQITGDDD